MHLYKCKKFPISFPKMLVLPLSNPSTIIGSFFCLPEVQKVEKNTMCLRTLSFKCVTSPPSNLEKIWLGMEEGKNLHVRFCVGIELVG